MPEQIHCFLCSNPIQNTESACSKCGWTWCASVQAVVTHQIDAYERPEDELKQFGLDSVRLPDANESMIDYARFVLQKIQENGFSDRADLVFMMFLSKKELKIDTTERWRIFDHVFGDANERRRRRRDPYWNTP